MSTSAQNSQGVLPSFCIHLKSVRFHSARETQVSSCFVHSIKGTREVLVWLVPLSCVSNHLSWRTAMAKVPQMRRNWDHANLTWAISRPVNNGFLGDNAIYLRPVKEAVDVTSKHSSSVSWRSKCCLMFPFGAEKCEAVCLPDLALSVTVCLNVWGSLSNFGKSFCFNNVFQPQSRDKTAEKGRFQLATKVKEQDRNGDLQIMGEQMRSQTVCALGLVLTKRHTSVDFSKPCGQPNVQHNKRQIAFVLRPMDFWNASTFQTWTFWLRCSPSVLASRDALYELVMQAIYYEQATESWALLPFYTTTTFCFRTLRVALRNTSLCRSLYHEVWVAQVDTICCQISVFFVEQQRRHKILISHFTREKQKKRFWDKKLESHPTFESILIRARLLSLVNISSFVPGVPLLCNNCLILTMLRKISFACLVHLDYSRLTPPVHGWKGTCPRYSSTAPWVKPPFCWTCIRKRNSSHRTPLSAFSLYCESAKE